MKFFNKDSMEKCIQILEEAFTILKQNNQEDRYIDSLYNDNKVPNPSAIFAYVGSYFIGLKKEKRIKKYDNHIEDIYCVLHHLDKVASEYNITPIKLYYKEYAICIGDMYKECTKNNLNFLSQEIKKTEEMSLKKTNKFSLEFNPMLGEIYKKQSEIITLEDFYAELGKKNPSTALKEKEKQKTEQEEGVKKTEQKKNVEKTEREKDVEKTEQEKGMEKTKQSLQQTNESYGDIGKQSGYLKYDYSSYFKKLAEFKKFGKINFF